MKKIIAVLILVLLLCSCAKEVNEVIEKYDNGNWKKVIVYKVKGENRERYKAIEYYEDGRVMREINLKDKPGFRFTEAKEIPKDESDENLPGPLTPNEDINYDGPYKDLMNQPGVVTRKLEGEEKERVLAAMRKKREEMDDGEEFTELDEDGNEVTKVRKVLEEFEDGSIKHEQIFVKIDENLELEVDNEYYANGKLRTTVPYKYGKANGKWFNYYRNGTLKTEGASENGSHHGKYAQYYENGNPMMKGQFKYGKMDGVWHYFWENGKRKMETTFQDDKDIGPLQRYDENGEPIKKQSPFRVGESYNFGDK